MSDAQKQAQKILARFKGLSQQLHSEEQPIQTFPAIWDAGTQAHGETCEVIITNQRLIGFYFRSFPREKLFFDALQLSKITHVTLRQKKHEPVFRELLVVEDKRKIYIRAPKKQIEALYSLLRSLTSQHAAEPSEETTPAEPPTTYGRQEMTIPFERSPLAIMLLFSGGIILEIVGLIVWSATHNASTGFPLCLAGLLAVFTAIFMQRQRRKTP